jgi:hypothetical protein
MEPSIAAPEAHATADQRGDASHCAAYLPRLEQSSYIQALDSPSRFTEARVAARCAAGDSVWSASRAGGGTRRRHKLARSVCEANDQLLNTVCGGIISLVRFLSSANRNNGHKRTTLGVFGHETDKFTPCVTSYRGLCHEWQVPTGIGWIGARTETTRPRTDVPARGSESHRRGARACRSQSSWGRTSARCLAQRASCARWHCGQLPVCTWCPHVLRGPASCAVGKVLMGLTVGVRMTP